MSKNINQGTAHDSVQPYRKQETPFVFSENGEVIDNTFTSCSTTEGSTNHNHYVEQLTDTQLLHSTTTTTATEQDCGSYITRFSNNNSIIGTRATYESFMAEATNPAIAQICKQLRELDPENDNYLTAKRILKDELPLYAYCGYNADNDRSKKKVFESNGNAIIDIDGVYNEKELQEIVAKILKWDEDTDHTKLLLLHRSPSYHGLRIVFVANPNLTMVENQIDFFTNLDIPLSYRDKGAHEVKRLSYMVCNDYMFRVSEKLFEGKNTPIKIADTTVSSSAPICDAVEWAENVTVDSNLIDNYYNNHGFKRTKTNRHNFDLKYGQDLNDLGIQANEVKAYYDAFIAKFKKEGFYFPDDPSESTEGINAVWWGFTHPKDDIKTHTFDSGNGALAVPYYGCTFDEMIDNFQNVVYQTSKIDEITFPKVMQESLNPILNNTAMRHLTLANVYNILTTAATYLHRVKYSTSADAYGESICLLTLVEAETSEGKSLAEKVYRLWAAALKEEEEQNAENYRLWKKMVKKAKKEHPDTFDEDDYPAPEMPILTIENMDSTGKGLFDLCQINDGRRLSVFCSEISNLTDSCENKNYGVKAATICQLYDTAKLTEIRSFAKAKELGLPSGRQEAIGAVNMVATGVPESLSSFFSKKDVNNGKASRFNIVEVKKVYNKPYNVNTYPDKKISEMDIIKPICRLMSMNRGTLVHPVFNQLCSDFFNAWLDYDSKDGKYHYVIDSMKNRAMDIARRNAMTLYFMEAASAGKYMTEDGWMNIDGDKLKSAPKVSDNVIKLFEYTANHILATQVRKFGKYMKINGDSTTVEEVEEQYNNKLSYLPDTFTRAQFYALYSSENCAKKELCRFKKNNQIKKLSKDSFQKI